MDRPELPEAIRASLPPVFVAYVGWLEEQVAAQAAEVARLREALAAAEAKAQQHSGNSSRPPSSDPPDAPKRPATKPTGRPRGGQPGHVGHQRALVSIEQVTAVQVHRPTTCAACGGDLAEDLPTVGEPARAPVWDIPAIVAPEVIEHQYPMVVCPHCQAAVTASRPPEVPESAFGPRVTALVGLLHGRYRLSMRETVALLWTLWGLAMSVGSVPRLDRRVSAALAAPYAEALGTVVASAAVHVDETSWPQAGRLGWLWVAVAATATVFLVAASRGGKVLTGWLGPTFRGIVHSDRHKAYRVIPPERRQVCWAHLKRNFAALLSWSGPIGAWGEQALTHVETLFAAWDRFRRGELDRDGLQRELAPVQAAVHALLQPEATQGKAKLVGMAAELAALWPALWTFLTVPGVDPTNNAAERQLRPGVLWRKGCHGTQSADGDRFVERLMTISATCQQHQRPLFPFLVDCVIAHQLGTSPPRLMPTP